MSDDRSISGAIQVRLYNFKGRTEEFKRRFSVACTTILWLPLVVDPSGQSLVVGFADGIIRVLQKTAEKKWRLSVAVKPHKL